jgi:putative transposase
MNSLAVHRRQFRDEQIPPCSALSDRTTQLTVLFLRELQQHVPVTQAAILVDNAHHLKAALSRLGLRFQIRRHGNRNAAERVFREVKL